MRFIRFCIAVYIAVATILFTQFVVVVGLKALGASVGLIKIGYYFGVVLGGVFTLLVLRIKDE
jgi:hypothetical protein